MMHYCKCGEKYASESSAKRCCTKTQKQYNRQYYLKHRDHLLEKQRKADQKKRNEKNIQRS